MSQRCCGSCCRRLVHGAWGVTGSKQERLFVGVRHAVLGQDVFDVFSLFESGSAGDHVAISLHAGEVAERAEVGHVPY